MKKNPRDYKVNGNQFAYLLDCIENSSIITDSERTFADDKERINYIWDVQLVPMVDACTPTMQSTIEHWLRGLGLNTIAIYNHEIEDLFKEWGIKPTEKNIDNYWSVMAYRLIQLHTILNK